MISMRSEEQSCHSWAFQEEERLCPTGPLGGLNKVTLLVPAVTEWSLQLPFGGTAVIV